MARILGLDIGAFSVKALLVESNFRGFVVRSFAEAKIDPETGVKGALAQLNANRSLAADQVVVAPPGTQVATHLMALPFTDVRKIEQTLGFEVEGQLPYDISEVVYDYQVLSTRADGKSELVVGVLKKDSLKELLATVQEAGVEPRTITTSALAYQSLLSANMTGDVGPAPVEGAEAIVDIGHERTSVCIGRRGGGIEYARSFQGGGKDLTRVISNEFKVSPADAQAWKENEGDITLEGATPEQERAAGALLRGLAPVIREIRGTFRAHQAKFHRTVERVYLCGGTSRLRGLEGLLAKELGCAVQALDALPKEATQSLPPGTAALAAQGFALAMRGHGTVRAARFNLRRGEFEFKGDLDYLKGKVSRLAAFAAVLVVLSGALTWAQFYNLDQREKAFDKILCDTTQKVTGQCQKDYLVAISVLKGKGSPTALIPTYSALDLFAELTNRAEKQKVKLDEIEVQLQRIRLRGEVESFDGVDKLVDALKTFKCFKEVSKGKVQRTKDGSKVQFDLDINVVCPDQARAEG